jgi:hypothetical protein
MSRHPNITMEITVNTAYINGMRDSVRAEVLALIGQMKRVAADPQAPCLLDRIAVDLISGDCRPATMVPGLQTWMGLQDAVV